MKADRQKPTLHRPAVYEIRVPGELDESWTDWFGKMSLTVESEGGGPPVTTLSGAVDQAALHGLLRRLYSLGLPLISVTFVEQGGTRSEKASDVGKEVWEEYRRQAQSLTKIRRNEMTVEQRMSRREEHRGFETLWWAGTLIWTGMVFGAASLDWLPQIGQADAWTWVFLGAGLYGLVGTVYRQASVDTLNPRTWDYVWSGFLLIVSLAGVAGVNAFWPAALILAGVAYLVSIVRHR